VATDPDPASTPGTNGVPVLPAGHEGRVHADRLSGQAPGLPDAGRTHRGASTATYYTAIAVSTDDAARETTDTRPTAVPTNLL